MNLQFFSALYEIDIFATKPGLFYNNKEKIGSYFGIILTIIYIISSLSIFIFHIIIIIEKSDFLINDYLVYSSDAPYINLKNNFYFDFGFLNKNNTNRFIDETIYTARAFYINKIKNSEGIFINKEERELKLEKCKIKKFDKNYQHLLNEKNLNNSYCIENLDLSLSGGYIYDNFSYITVEIYPCENNSENNSLCKSKEIIDNTLEGRYFSISLEDIEINPSNYSFPILPLIQNYQTLLNQNFSKDIIFFYEITEVQSDSGIFFEEINKNINLKLNEIKENFYYIGDKFSNKRKMICKIEIRLSNNINIKKRIYPKITHVFSITGGYMQIIYTFFSLLSLIPNKFRFDKIIVNNLINLDINFEKKNYNFNYNCRKNSTIFLDTFNKEINKNNKNNYIVLDNENEKRNSVNVDNMIHNKLKRKNNFSFLGDVRNISFKDERSNNASRAEIIPKNDESKNFGVLSINKSIDQSVNRSVNRSINRSVNRSVNRRILMKNYSKEISFFNNLKRKKIKNISLNIFEYYCFGKLFNKKKDIDLLYKGSFIFKERMDLINLFRDLLFFDNCIKYNFNQEKNNLNHEVKIVSRKKNSVNLF